MAMISSGSSLLLLLLTVFTCLVTAIPTRVRDASPTCVTGVAADDGGWPIDYAEATTAPSATSYDVDPTWAAAHALQTSASGLGPNLK